MRTLIFVLFVAATLTAGQARAAGGCPELYEAAGNGEDAKVAALLDAGLDVNCRSSKNLNLTALIAAAAGGRVSTVQLLLKRGADLNKAALEGSTALSYAQIYKRDEVVKILMAPLMANQKKAAQTAPREGAAPGFAQTAPDPLLPIVKGGRFGYIDRGGEVVIPLKFHYAERFSEGLARVGIGGLTCHSTGNLLEHWIAMDNGKCGASLGYIDKTGAVVIPPGEYSMAGAFKEGMARIQKSGYPNKYGFIDKTGKTVIKPEFEHAQDFSEGLAGVGVGGQWGVGAKWGFIDKTGAMIVKPQFDHVTKFAGGVALALDFDRWKAIDTSGKVLFKLPTSLIAPNHKVCPAAANDSDRSCSEIPVPFPDGFERVGKTKYGDYRYNNDTYPYHYIDRKGKAIPGKFHVAKPFSEGLAPVREWGGTHLWGFIDTTGKFVSLGPPGVEDARRFSEGLAALRMGGEWTHAEQRFVGAKWGFVDKTGMMITEYKYDDVADFHDGAAAVIQDGKTLYIDTTGEVIWSQ